MSLKQQKAIDFQAIERELTYLKQHQVVIGFFAENNSVILEIVRATEYGAHLIPKKGNYLWLPTATALKQYGKSVKPQDIKGLFIPKGKHFACARQHGQLVAYFYVTKRIDLPAKPFIRKALAENKIKYRQEIKTGVNRILLAHAKGRDLLASLGKTASDDLRQSLITWSKKEHQNKQIDKLVDEITWKIWPLGGD